jgi:class 3 adenylate cyclase
VVELPTGTVTFLFTDLEASTQLWEQRREAMHAALARHDELLILSLLQGGWSRRKSLHEDQPAGAL